MYSCSCPCRISDIDKKTNPILTYCRNPTLYSDVGGSDIRLSSILFITDIGLRAPFGNKNLKLNTSSVFNLFSCTLSLHSFFEVKVFSCIQLLLVPKQ
jgi:hypothetical protein